MTLFLVGFGIGTIGHWAFDRFVLPSIKAKIAGWVK
jgi:hypothetical protein